MSKKIDLSEYRCPFDHVIKDCGHSLNHWSGYDDTHSIWCQCGFRAPVFADDPVELKLRLKTENKELNDVDYQPISMSMCVDMEHYWKLKYAQALQRLEEANATIKALGDNLNDANKERASYAEALTEVMSSSVYMTGEKRRLVAIKALNYRSSDDGEERCNCSMGISITDGVCRDCHPQSYMDALERTVDELSNDVERGICKSDVINRINSIIVDNFGDKVNIVLQGFIDDINDDVLEL